MATIKLKGREIPLLYTTLEMKELQEEIAPLGELQYIIVGRNKDDENDSSLYGRPEHLDAIAKSIRILGNAGLEDAGMDPDLTDKKVLRALRPGELPEAVNTCMKAMNEGMRSEFPEKEEEGPVDVTLEKLKKKEPKDD